MPDECGAVGSLHGLGGRATMQAHSHCRNGGALMSDLIVHPYPSVHQYGPEDAPLMTKNQLDTLLLMCGLPKRHEIHGKTRLEFSHSYVEAMDKAFANLIGNGRPTSRKQWVQWQRYCYRKCGVPFSG